jgi:hypothetical protein
MKERSMPKAAVKRDGKKKRKAKKTKKNKK